MKKVVYTDLDGTLLDLKTYSFIQSLKALDKLKSAGVPLIFCSSKTRKEQEYLQKAMGIREPFIVENGSAIFIPKGYFLTQIPYNTYHTDDYEVICLGRHVDKIREVLANHRSHESLSFKFYEDLAVTEVVQITGLEGKAAERAMQRDYSETILTGETSDTLYKELEKEGFHSIPGSKFETVISKSADKGRAVRILNSLFEAEYGQIRSYGIGDSRNDEAMLNEVDQAYLVQKENEVWAEMTVSSPTLVSAVGPKGWEKTIENIIC